MKIFVCGVCGMGGENILGRFSGLFWLVFGMRNWCVV